MRMFANDANQIIHKELSYKIVGVLYETHNKLGRFALERQYGNFIENLLKEKQISYEREKQISLSGSDKNKADFLISDIILLELKAKPFLIKDDYYQLLRYLQASKVKLGIIVNFRNKYLRPKRIINSLI